MTKDSPSDSGKGDPPRRAASGIRPSVDPDTLDQMIAALGHDLRTPLSMVVIGLGALRLGQRLHFGDLQMLERMERSAKRMSRMVDDLLELTRVRVAASIPICPTSFDLRELCEELVSELAASRPDASLFLRADGPIDGSWDADRIAQVVSNLLRNALEHGTPGFLVTLSLRVEGNAVDLSVHNQGPPIPAEELARVFEPYHRLRTSASRRGEGALGVGLTICRQIVIAHRGQISVSSSADAGTTFQVRLPRYARVSSNPPERDD